MRTPLLVVHIAAGSAGLIFGLIAMFLPKRAPWHPRVGDAYQVSVALLCASALGLVALEPGLWGLGLIAGLAVRRRQRAGWIAVHVNLMGGSYISLVTAFLVVNLGGPVAWVLPSLAGSPLIARAVRRASGREPATL